MSANRTGTRIVATVGPASSSPRQIERLLRNNVAVFRVNFSHGSAAGHVENLATIRRVSRRIGIPCGVLADLQGPKIRTGHTRDDRTVFLRKGARVVLVTTGAECDEKSISVDFPRLADEVQPGHRIQINDGALGLRVVEVDSAQRLVECVVGYAGGYSSRKGVNIPGVPLSLPSLTAKDKKDLRIILAHDFDYIALSFVRTASDLAPLNRAVKRSGRPVRIIAKIEKPQAVENLDAICAVCSGIMVARGDLGVETSVEQVPLLQKELITRANALGKQVIVATQMLESMIHQPLPTRAEASDVANAILDGTDAVMLSGETAVGKHAVAAVATMHSIIGTVERSRWCSGTYVNLNLSGNNPVHSVCEAAATASADLGNAAVVVFTQTGATAWYLSKIRCQAPVFAFSPDSAVVAQLCLAWNCTPLQLPFNENLDELIAGAERALLHAGAVRRRDLVVIVGGTTTVRGATNFMRVKEVGR